MSHKTILWYVSKFSAPGGGERWVLEGSKVLKEKGLKVKIVTTRFNENVFFEGKYNEEVFVLKSRVGHRIFKPIKYVSYIFQLIKIVNNDKVDIILSQDYGGYVISFFTSLFTKTPYGLFDFGQLLQIPTNNIKYSYIFKKKIVKMVDEILININEKILDKNKKFSIFNKILLEIKAILLFYTFKRSSIIFTLSERVKKENFYLYKKKAYVIKAAYSNSFFSELLSKSDIERNSNTIVTVGRLVPHKRVDLLLKSINKLTSDGNKEIQLVIGGKGPEKEKLIKIIDDLKLKKNVELKGFIPEYELIDFYLQGNIFITMDSADFDITVYLAIMLGRYIIVPTIMEIDEVFIRSGRVIKVLPNAEDIAVALGEKIGKQILALQKEEINVLKQYTWENGFLKVFHKINEVVVK